MPSLPVIFCLILLAAFPAMAASDTHASCSGQDTACMLEELETLTAAIDEPHWKDQTYRELAKLLVREKQNDRAIGLIARIEHPDTKAMTIRGIGMAAAKTDLTAEQFTALFANLRAEAEKIEHPPSYAIALTYIAMAQAFAGADEGAMKTALDMENDALRNKALGETAEIQAERGDLSHAMASIAAIESPAFRNKAYRTISKIFADREKYDEAMNAAMAIDNSYQKAQSVLYILSRQIAPEDTSLVE